MKNIYSMFIFLGVSLGTNAQVPNSWSFVNYNGGSNGATTMGKCASFTIANCAYVLTGGVINSWSNNFWKYNTSTQVWTPLAAFPGGARTGAIAFTIDGKGYCGFGYDGSSYLNDLWKYDTITQWSLVPVTTPYPPTLNAAVGFSIGKKGFVGTGFSPSLGGETGVFWEWNSVNNTWAQRQSLPGGIKKYIASAFTIGSKGYIGLGSDGISGPTQSFYSWDTVTTSWTSLPPFPGLARSGATAFSIGTKGYVGSGTSGNPNVGYTDFFEWDPISNAWTVIPTIAGLPVGQGRYYATGFSVGNKGYIVGGGLSGVTFNDLWKYTPLTPPTPSICLVTVDTLSINNEIYWEKALYPQADTFIVLRETSSSNYTPIARISKNAFSSYVDTNRSKGPFNGNPNFTSYKYKLQYHDAFGNYSAQSPYHQSIFIQDQQNGNFNWNYYFIEGIGNIQTATYILSRRNVNTGITTTVGATSANSASDNQYTSLAQTGNVKWFVSTSGFNCTPSQMKAGKNGTKSNSSNERQFPTSTGIGNHVISQNDIQIYPNPADNNLNIECAIPALSIQTEIRDVTGRLLVNELLNGGHTQMDLKNLSNGIYFLSLYTDDRLIDSRKIIVQHY
ncbi:MAG: T9SS type A sorting domain-containing protein [bacterium]|nr:T9SS type A sorting domain-containing protein [bacterium]